MALAGNANPRLLPVLTQETGLYQVTLTDNSQTLIVNVSAVSNATAVTNGVDEFTRRLGLKPLTSVAVLIPNTTP